MLRTRLLLSAVLIPAFIGFCWLDAQTTPGMVLMPLLMLLTLQAGREASGLMARRDVSSWRCAFGSAAVLAGLWGWHLMHPVATGSVSAVGAAAVVFAGVVTLLLCVQAARFTAPAGQTGIIAAETFVIAYAGLLLACAAELRWIGEGRLGWLAVGSLLIGAKVGDIGGYTFGRLFGRRKLAPALSPGKTWAGAVGAVITAAVFVALWLDRAAPQFVPEARVVPFPRLLLFGAVLGIVGLVGDLCESLLKRDAGRKDAAALMPAFGGLLDVLDSILYTAPLTLAVWLLAPPVR